MPRRYIMKKPRFEFGVYNPPPDEIERMCQHFQSTWSEEERAKRLASAFRQRPAFLVVEGNYIKGHRRNFQRAGRVE